MDQLKQAVKEFEESYEEKSKELNFEEVITEILNAFQTKLESKDYTFKKDDWEYWDQNLVVYDEKSVDWGSLNNSIIEIKIGENDFDYWKWDNIAQNDKSIRKSIEINLGSRLNKKYPEIIAVHFIWAMDLILHLKITK